MHRNWYQIWYPIWRKSQSVVNFKIVSKKSKGFLVDFGYRCQILQRTPDLFKYLVSRTFFEKRLQSSECACIYIEFYYHLTCWKNFERVWKTLHSMYLHSKEILSTLEFACHQRLLFWLYLRPHRYFNNSERNRNRKGPINSSGIRIDKSPLSQNQRVWNLNVY